MPECFSGLQSEAWHGHTPHCFAAQGQGQGQRSGDRVEAKGAHDRFAPLIVRFFGRILVWPVESSGGVGYNHDRLTCYYLSTSHQDLQTI